MTNNARFFLVQADILPDSIQKTLKAKEMLLKGEASTINEAVERVNLSRSAFYKYRNSVFALQDEAVVRNVTINLTLEHRPGVLSRVLSNIAALGGNILTINQEMPARGQARVDIHLDISETTGEMETVIGSLEKIDGVKSVSLQEGSLRRR